MNHKTFKSILTIGALAVSTVAFLVQPGKAQSTNKFFCGTSSDGVPTTFVRQATGKTIALIRWEKEWGGEWTPEKRCEAVSANFQKANEEGALKYFALSRVGKDQIVCGMPLEDFPGAECTNRLFTIRREEKNAQKVVKQLLSVGTQASARPLIQSPVWDLYRVEGILAE